MVTTPPPAALNTPLPPAPEQALVPHHTGIITGTLHAHSGIPGVYSPEQVVFHTPLLPAAAPIVQPQVHVPEQHLVLAPVADHNAHPLPWPHPAAHSTIQLQAQSGVQRLTMASVKADSMGWLR